MDPIAILQALTLAESLFTNATTAWAQAKATADATTRAQVEAALASSGAALDAATKLLDQDAA